MQGMQLPGEQSLTSHRESLMATPEENLYLAAAAILGGSVTTMMDNNWTDEQGIEYAIQLAKELAIELKKEKKPK